MAGRRARDLAYGRQGKPGDWCYAARWRTEVRASGFRGSERAAETGHKF
jgi:hypothetical protein